MYKIYINKVRFVLTSTKKLKKGKYQIEKALIAPYSGRSKFLLNYIDLAEKSGQVKTIIIHSPNYKQLKIDFLSLFRRVDAAGTLVVNQDSKILIIFRRGYWDLPKGKMEPEEHKKVAALRELAEETGIKEASIIGKFAKTYHTYRNTSKKRILKRTYWYLAQTNQVELEPQASEGIHVAKWVDLDQFLNMKPKIFGNIYDLLIKYQEKKKKISKAV